MYALHKAQRPASTPAPRQHRLRIAAILNGNARQVTPEVYKTLEQVLPGRVHLTHTPEASEQQIKKLLDQGIELLFVGGGDGTLIQAINTVRGLRAEADQPLIGLLPLGTGNALAAHFGLGDPLSQLALASHNVPMKERELRLLDVEGHHTPFAGVGVDAMIVNDYIDLKRWARGRRLVEPLCAGLPGYLAATTLRTLPRMLDWRQPSKQATIVNSGRNVAFHVSAEGQTLAAIKPGDVIYQGPVFTASASTSSCYGFGLKVFPLADQDPDRFHLRIYHGGGIDPLLKVGRLFKGTYTSPKLHDVLAERVTVTIDGEMPLQVAGDAHGWKREVSFGLAKERTRIWMPDTQKIN